MSSRWVRACEAAKQLVAEDEFALHGNFSSKQGSKGAKWRFNVDKSLERARAETAKCFSGMAFLLSDSMEPKKEQMKPLIERAGGKVVPRLPPKPSHGDGEQMFAVLVPDKDEVRPCACARAPCARGMAVCDCEVRPWSFRVPTHAPDL